MVASTLEKTGQNRPRMTKPRTLAPDRIIGGEIPTTPDALDRIETINPDEIAEGDDEASSDRPSRDE